MSERLALRASDADRLEAEERLRRHHLEGRLTLEEFEDRVEAAQRAVTLGELELLQADLPRPRPPARRRRRSARLPGRMGFAERAELEGDAANAYEQALGTIVPTMVRAGYALEDRSPRRLVFVHRRAPGWAIAASILLFPFGLIALLARDTERVVVEFEAREAGGCVVLTHGVAPLAVRQAFAELSD